MSDKVTVLTVNRVGFLGGVERVIVGCGKAGTAHGFRMLLACPEEGELAHEARLAGIETLPISIDRSKAELKPAAIFRFVRSFLLGSREIHAIAFENCVQLIHAHHPIGALCSLYAAWHLRIPLILHVHETLPVHFAYRWMARCVVSRCAAIICVSKRSRELIESLRCRTVEPEVIYNGVDPTFLEPARPVCDVQGDGPHVGVFGVLEPRKGQDLFIAAAQIVAAIHPRAQFWIVGGVSFNEHGSFLAKLKSAVADAGLAGRVHFTGHRRDVRDLMVSMDVIVLSSRSHESLPTVLIEGALLGRPLVSTNVGGVTEIIDHERTGLVVSPNDPAALAQAVLTMLGIDGLQMASESKQKAECQFTFGRFAEALTQKYRSVVMTGYKKNEQSHYCA